MALKFSKLAEFALCAFVVVAFAMFGAFIRAVSPDKTWEQIIIDAEDIAIYGLIGGLIYFVFIVGRSLWRRFSLKRLGKN
jgi:hypothetical protein